MRAEPACASTIGNRQPVRVTNTCGAVSPARMNACAPTTGVNTRPQMSHRRPEEKAAPADIAARCAAHVSCTAPVPVHAFFGPAPAGCRRGARCTHKQAIPVATSENCTHHRHTEGSRAHLHAPGLHKGTSRAPSHGRMRLADEVRRSEKNIKQPRMHDNPRTAAQGAAPRRRLHELESNETSWGAVQGPWGACLANCAAGRHWQLRSCQVLRPRASAPVAPAWVAPPPKGSGCGIGPALHKVLVKAAGRPAPMDMHAGEASSHGVQTWEEGVKTWEGKEGEGWVRGWVGG